ncbi:MAG TPA: hypothetical protein PKA90_09590 [Ignavibacteria bacterium]|nr:hypothetical protein [Ignavibacteria bacterium]HMR40667.1 hypothetical protein [Ignavibacteria bacterium]
MGISENTKTLIEEINDKTQKPLKNIYEVSVIIENTGNENKAGLFKDLIFTAKYVKGLKKVLSGQVVNKDDFMERMFEEFNKNVLKFSEYLKDSVESSDEKTKTHFSRKYFELNHECLLNTMELIEDLSMCKEFFNANPGYLDRLQEPGIRS